MDIDEILESLYGPSRTEQRLSIAMATGFCVLVPLGCITMALLVTGYSSRLVKSLLLVTTVAMASSLVALALLRWPYHTRRHLLTSSDSLQLALSPGATLFCKSLQLLQKPPSSLAAGLQAWTSPISDPGRVVMENVTLQSAFTLQHRRPRLLPFMLRSGDRISMEFARPYSLNVSVVQGWKKFRELRQLIRYGSPMTARDLGSCCKPLPLTQFRHLDYITPSTELNEPVFLVFWLILTQEQVKVHANSRVPAQIDVEISELQLRRAVPRPSSSCEPLHEFLCSEEKCVLELPSSHGLLSVHSLVPPNSQPSLHSVILQIECRPSHWLYATLLGLLPLLLLLCPALFLINFTRRCDFRSRKQRHSRNRRFQLPQLRADAV